MHKFNQLMLKRKKLCNNYNAVISGLHFDLTAVLNIVLILDCTTFCVINNLQCWICCWESAFTNICGCKE